MVERTEAPTPGIDPRGVIDFLDACSVHELHSLQVLWGGRPIVRGVWAPYEWDDRALVYSLSKTFTSAVVGLCVADGLFGYDDTVVSHFPEYAEGVGPKAARIRVRDCLAMATGHEQDLLDFADRRRLDRSAIERMLHMEPTGEPGVTFCYNQIANYTLSVLVHKTSGRSVMEVLREHIFEPLGAPELFWQRDLDGLPLGFSGLHVDPGTVARFWQLVADDGILDGRQLLAPEWVERHRVKQVETDPQRHSVFTSDGQDWSRGYGWQCWMQSHGYRGDGAFGQYAIVLRELDTVIVITSEVAEMQAVLDKVWQHLLPALGSAGTPDDRAELDERLARLSLPAIGGALPTEELGGRQAAITARASVDGDQLLLRWTEGPSTQVVRVGRGEWVRNHLVWEEGWLDVAASGGMDGDELAVDLLVLNTPHTVHVRLGQDSLDWRWSLEPLGGAADLRTVCMMARMAG